MIEGTQRFSIRPHTPDSVLIRDGNVGHYFPYIVPIESLPSEAETAKMNTEQFEAVISGLIYPREEEAEV